MNAATLFQTKNQKFNFYRFAFRSKTKFETECEIKITGFFQFVCLFSFIRLKICDTLKEFLLLNKNKWISEITKEKDQILSWINEVKKVFCYFSPKRGPTSKWRMVDPLPSYILCVTSAINILSAFAASSTQERKDSTNWFVYFKS